MYFTHILIRLQPLKQQIKQMSVNWLQVRQSSALAPPGGDKAKSCYELVLCCLTFWGPEQRRTSLASELLHSFIYSSMSEWACADLKVVTDAIGACVVLDALSEVPAIMTGQTNAVLTGRSW